LANILITLRTLTELQYGYGIYNSLSGNVCLSAILDTPCNCVTACTTWWG